MVQEKETVLVKISGECLSGEGGTGLQRQPIYDSCSEIDSIADLCNVVVIGGGGNLVRGKDVKSKISRRDTPIADDMGMLATVINALMLQDILEGDFNRETRVMSAVEMRKFCEVYIRRRAMRHLQKGRIVIVACGMGEPDFSTDMAMVCRAKQLGVKTVFKGTKVDGIYNKDPKAQKRAKFIHEITYREYLMRNLRIVDPAAVSQAQNLGIKIKVFNLFIQGNLRRVLTQKDIGSVIH